MVRDPERYFFSVFGTPSPRGAWGWRVEGHHVSLNFTVVNGASRRQHAVVLRFEPGGGPRRPEEGAADSGAAGGLGPRAAGGARRQPAQPRHHQRGGAGRHCDDEQREGRSAAAGGHRGRRLTPNQRDLLLRVIDAYVGAMATDLAADRMAKVTKAASRRSRSRGPASSSAASGTTTVCRDRRS